MVGELSKGFSFWPFGLAHGLRQVTHSLIRSTLRDQKVQKISVNLCYLALCCQGFEQLYYLDLNNSKACIPLFGLFYRTLGTDWGLPGPIKLGFLFIEL